MGPLKNPKRYMIFLYLDWMVKLCWNLITILKIYEMAMGKYWKSYTIIYSIFISLFSIGHILSSLLFFPIIILFNPNEFKHVSSCSDNNKCLKFLTGLKIVFWLIPIMLLDWFHFMYIMFSGFGFFNAKDRQKS